MVLLSRLAGTLAADKREKLPPWAVDSGTELKGCYSLARCIGTDWKIPAPETWEAISNAASTAGTLINLRNWSIERIDDVPQVAFEANSVRPLHRRLIAGEKLVGINRPRNREQRENRDDRQRLHDAKVGFDCGQKGQSLVHFQDQQMGTSWPRGSCACCGQLPEKRLLYSVGDTPR
jgi:hypothetical protein